MKRKRVHFALLVFLAILLGLTSRKFPTIFTSHLAFYLGDTLWALMVFFMMGFIWQRKKTINVGILALVFSYGIELSQLYQAPWINSIRHTTLGGLILGYGFLWSDLICYSIGILLGMCLEILFYHRIFDDR